MATNTATTATWLPGATRTTSNITIPHTAFNNTLLALAGVLGLDDEGLDSLFVEAAKL